MTLPLIGTLKKFNPPSIRDGVIEYQKSDYLDFHMKDRLITILKSSTFGLGILFSLRPTASAKYENAASVIHWYRITVCMDSKLSAPVICFAELVQTSYIPTLNFCPGQPGENQMYQSIKLLRTYCLIYTLCSEL